MYLKFSIWLISIGLLTYSCKQSPIRLYRIEGKQISLNSEIDGDSSIAEFIGPYREKLENKMNRVLAYTPTDLYSNREKVETNIGNFMADLCYKRGNPIFRNKTNKNIDFVLLNFGGIRADISKGNVTVGDAYKLMPFENNMLVVELSYNKIQNLLNYLANSHKAHPISKQLCLKFKNDTLISAQLNGKKFDENKSYFVLTSDYLQKGGDRMNFFKEPLSLTNLDYKIRKAILDELEEIDTIKAKEDGRVIRR